MSSKAELLSRFSKLTKEDQIEVILHRFLDQKVALQFDDPEIYTAEIARVFSVTADDIRAHVKEKGLPGGYVSSDPSSSRDGRYLVEEEDKFVIYDQEHGSRWHDQYFATKEEALNYLIEADIEFYLQVRTP